MPPDTEAPTSASDREAEPLAAQPADLSYDISQQQLDDAGFDQPSLSSDDDDPAGWKFDMRDFGNRTPFYEGDYNDDLHGEGVEVNGNEDEDGVEQDHSGNHAQFYEGDYDNDQYGEGADINEAEDEGNVEQDLTPSTPPPSHQSRKHGLSSPPQGKASVFFSFSHKH
jgi:hypothetical protein